MSLNSILRYFSPRWFIAIMGTGALANILQLIDAGRSGYWGSGAVALMSLCLIAFPVALALLLSRLWVDRRIVVSELRHSSLVQFYSAVFIAASICATGLLKIPLPWLSEGHALFLAKLLWGFSAVTGVTLSLYTPWRIITLDHGEPKRILGFWFLPPVGLFVLVFAGNFLALHPGNASWLPFIAVFNAVVLGAALIQGAMLFVLFLFRALAYPFPRSDVVPSFTIGLAPVGVSIIALLTYLPVLGQSTLPLAELAETVTPVVKFMTLLIWGFGFWWLLVAMGVIAFAFRHKGVPFSLGYWAFVFPPAAFTIATLLVADATGLGMLTALAQAFAYALVLLWTIIFATTVRAVFNRSIFVLPPSFQEILPRNGSE